MARRLGRSLRRNKKGSIQDIILMGIVALFFSVVVLIGLKVATEFKGNIDSNSVFDVGLSRSAVDTSITRYTRAVDNMFLFLIFFMGIVTLILAALIRVHPIFVPLFFIGLVITIFLTAIFANIYQEISSDTELSTITADLPFMNNIMLILPVIVGVFGLFLMFILYKLWSVG